MTAALPVSSVVNVQLLIAPVAAAARNFGSLLILGSTNVIDVTERLRLYADITSIANDFGTDAPEYKAALLFFSQSPRPAFCYVGRWAQVATGGLLKGGVRSTAQQAIDVFTDITDGSFVIDIDGTEQIITGLDFSGETNLNGVASVITTELTGAVATWDAVYSRFVITSATTGASSTIGYAADHVSGTAVAGLLGLVFGTASVPVDGVPPETLIDAVQAMADKSGAWYGLMVAAAVATNADRVAVSAFIEASEPSRIVGWTTQEPLALDPTNGTDIASLLKAGGYSRSFVQYSSDSPYAVASVLGRAFTVNFGGENTTITLKFKQQPTVQPEALLLSQANTLKGKNCNVFVAYNNDTAILQEGVMSDSSFIDERIGLDWLQNDLQNAVWNLHYTNTTKIPQTNGGMNRYCAVIEDRLEQARRNGLVAAGVWRGDAFGVLKTGDYLEKGYYVYAADVDLQSQADREARKATVIQIAIKLAGAIHFVDVLVNVNR